MKCTRRDFMIGTAAMLGTRSLLANGKNINLYNTDGNKILNAALFDASFWNGADVTNYQDQIMI